MELGEQARELNPEDRTGEETSEGKPATADFPQVDAASQATTPPFPVAGIGASAGGLEALRSFLKARGTKSSLAWAIGE